ncbi:MAG: S-layer homology domain-containing protein [Thermoleophilia bacterium]
MKLVRTTSMIAAVATTALTLALGGAALASPMGTTGMSGGGGVMPGTHMATTTTTTGTTGTTGTTTPGGMMGGTTIGTTVPGGMMGGTIGTTVPGGMMGGTTGTTVPGGAGTGQMGTGHMFADVVPGEWFQQYAEHMVEQGFMSGFADGTFGGDQSITRGQFAGIMARMMGLQPTDGGSFTDTAGFWGASAIEALAQSGVVAGYSNGAFGPYDDITRAQMAAMMDRAWEWMEQNGAGTGLGMDTAGMAQLREEMHQRLQDVQGSWAEDHIAHMFGVGVLQGDQSGMFHPQATTTRAQASAMMWRWYEALQ